MLPFHQLGVRSDGYLVKYDGTVVCYTDGACRGNHQKKERYSGSGIYWGPRRQNYSIHFPRTQMDENTNQFAEARAILYAAR